MSRKKITLNDRIQSGSSKAFAIAKSRFSKSRAIVIDRSKKMVEVIDRRPLTSLFVALGVLLLFLVLGMVLQRKPDEAKKPDIVKMIQTFKIGKNPQIIQSAKVEKTGIAKITSQMGGIVSTIAVVEGQEVQKGQNLLSLSNNYQGGNASSIQRELAGVQYKNTKDTYDLQKDIIQKQRDLTNKNRENSEELRKITDQSVSDTQSIIDLNNTILSTLNTNLTNLRNSNVGGSNDQLILSTQQMISQFQGANSQLNAGIAQTRYQVDTNKPANQLADIQKDVALKQLEVQEKALQLGLDSSGLQLQLAQIQESLMYPVAPFSGIVERINVTEGQSVTPGAPLLTIHGEQSQKAVLLVPQDIAKISSRITPSTLTIGRKTFETVPYYVSGEATDGQLYAIYYAIPAQFQDELTNNSYIQVKLPLSSVTSSLPYIPVDAVYQGQNESYVYINENNVATTKKVTLGNVYGRFVEIKKGLTDKDEIILNRNIISGDKVTTK